MSTEQAIEDAIDRAAERVARHWPLHSFVTANPLAGFEDRPFNEAVGRGELLFGGAGYPDAATFRSAWEAGRIDPDVLTELLDRHGHEDDPETLLDRMAQAEIEAERDAAGVRGRTEGTASAEQRMERVLTKWLAAFFDQGGADWPLPDRDDGLYSAVLAAARYDRHLPAPAALADCPAEPTALLADRLDQYPADRWEAIATYHFTALPGWTGYVRHRAETDDEWGAEAPATLAGYLALRIVFAEQFGAPILPPDDWHAQNTVTSSSEALSARDDRSTDATAFAEPTTRGDSSPPLPAIWLSAWEATYRDRVIDAVTDVAPDPGTDGGEAVHAPVLGADDAARPAAQLVFCIDTRSEVIRRHIEEQGPYETHGYAGFFGIPMRHAGYDAAASADACPPIVDPDHRVAEQPVEGRDAARAAHDRWSRLTAAAAETIHTLRSNPGTAFPFVESAGVGYGATLAARTVLPERVADALAALDRRVPDVAEFCRPVLDPESDPDADGEDDLIDGIPLEQRVEYAQNAFELMGWQEFAPVVVFAGHASQTANNPFDSSLDCGACAGNPGGPNARVLAAICNDPAVREALVERGIDVPDDTVFVAAEHDTTTDAITLFDDGVETTARHDDVLDTLRADLDAARAGAAAERVAAMDGDPDDGVGETERRAADWAEPRPEWGLAGNAAFVIGPRELTSDVDLDGRAFLHSYDPATDDDGAALEAIMNGPMVVTQWINSQYYFATVDPGTYGSGSKVTQNPVGNVGVYQGNGGDLMTGLPLQSVRAADDEPYHQPLRLSVIVAAPAERVQAILDRNGHLASLFDNRWLSLTAVDPEQAYRAVRYEGDGAWSPPLQAQRVEAEPRATSVQ